MTKPPPHPVWEVYNAMKTARLNIKYYSCLLNRYRRQNFWIELFLAACSSSAVGGLWIIGQWKDGVLWKILATLAAGMAVYRPVAKITERIGTLEGIVAKYRGIEVALDAIRIRIRNEEAYTEGTRSAFEGIMAKFGELKIETTSFEGQVRKGLRSACEMEVDEELPLDSFYVPPPTVVNPPRRP